ncbi:MAG: hypothetical protein STSR0002_21200 [Smithella sp.]
MLLIINDRFLENKNFFDEALQVGTARYENKMTTGLRKQSKSFPANLLAGMYGFKDGAFFDAPKE